jgi:DivIVA domain-containing protein
MQPEDIESKEFLVVLRGYDKDQVREFLAQVAAAFRKVSTGAEHAAVDDDAVPAEIASVMRAVVAEAVNIRAEAERDAAEIRAAALENPDNPAARLWKAFTGLRNIPPGH